MTEGNCTRCNYDFKVYEHYVRDKYDEPLCENCFFDIALNELKATGHQYGLGEEVAE